MVPKRHRTPATPARPPTEARSKSRPMPGPPSGKVENSRCRGTSADQEKHVRNRSYKSVAKEKTPHRGIFEYPFRVMKLQGNLLSQMNNATADTDSNSLGAIAGAQFIHNVLDVDLYRLLSDEEFFGDVAIAV